MIPRNDWDSFPFHSVLEGLQSFSAHMLQQGKPDYSQRVAVTSFLCGAGHALNMFTIQCMRNPDADASELLDALRAEVEQLLATGAKQ